MDKHSVLRPRGSGAGEWKALGFFYVASCPLFFTYSPWGPCSVGLEIKRQIWNYSVSPLPVVFGKRSPPKLDDITVFVSGLSGIKAVKKAVAFLSQF